MPCISKRGLLEMDFGVNCRHERLEWLVPVLRKWAWVINEYCESHSKDAPYYYSERSNVGLLAAAAWACGFGALEEYPCDRVWDDNESRGRSDLYLYDRQNGASVEAKQCWLGREGDAESVNVLLAEANRQVNANPEQIQRLALVFATPHISADGLTEKALADFIEHAKTVVHESEAHLIGWVFPESKGLKFKAEDAYGKRRAWPGVLVAIRAAHKGWRP